MDLKIYEKPYPIIVFDGIPLADSDYYSKIIESRLENEPLKNNDRIDFELTEYQNSKIGNDIRRIIGKDFLAMVVDKLDTLQKKAPYQKTFDIVKDQISKAKFTRQKSGEISYFSYLSTNTPVTKASSVRGVHLDYPDKQITGLIYIDNGLTPGTCGGELIIHKWKDWVPEWLKYFLYKENVPKKFTEECFKVTPKHGTAVFFVNGLDSLHSVAPRPVVDKFRIFYNYIVESEDECYRTARRDARAFTRGFS